MQLPKNNHYQDHSLFAEPLLLHDPPTPNSAPFTGFKSVPKSHPPSEEEVPPNQDSASDEASVDPNELRFYQQYKKIYTVSHHLVLEQRRQVEIWEGLNKRIRTLEVRMEDIQEKMGQSEDKKKGKTGDHDAEDSKMKRPRRTAEEIEKKYKCQVLYCQRTYGSQGSLQQHIKLKHPHLYHKSHDESTPHRQGDISF